jgi:hypothetical protein
MNISSWLEQINFLCGQPDLRQIIFLCSGERSSYPLIDVEHCAEWKGSVQELEMEGCGRSNEKYVIAIT